MCAEELMCASDLSGLKERPLKQSQECRVDRHVSRWEMEVPAVVLLRLI